MLSAVIIAIYSVFNWRHLTAVWLANLGALRLAQVQLTDFPMDEWSGREFGDSLVSAQNLFESAISLDPTNQTALYRLGLIALEEQDFQTAIDYLNAAYRQDKGHRGVIKHLGYAYVWGRQYEKAQTFLSGIPEARSEMQTYSLWWVIHKRPDLSKNAEEMARRLANMNSIRPVALSSWLVIP
jgi:lipopolysaccharide biosynthesis regulator YciM